MPTEVQQDGTSINESSTAIIAVNPTSGSQTEKVLDVRADLLKEYVAVSASPFAPGIGTAYLRQLPNPSDDLMRDFGTRLYEEDMLRDPQLYSTLSVLIMAILCQGMRLNPPMDDGQDGYEQAIKVRDFCDYNIENMYHNMPDILFELIQGMLSIGHKVGEFIYEQKDIGDGGGQRIVLADIKTKPSTSTAFVVDAFNNILGLLYVKPGQPIQPIGTISGVIDSGPNANNIAKALIPRSKFIIPTYRPRNGDPRGTSHLKSVYTPWWKKQMLTPQHMAYVARFAQPSLWAKLPPTAKDIPQLDSSGAISGYVSIVQATTDALVQMKSGAAASFIDTDVEMLEATGDAGVIFASYDHEDRQIAKGILMQTLTTEEGEHMARAASAIHQDVFGILIAYIRSSICWCIRYDMLKPLVRYNFGEEAAAKFLPTVSLGDTQAQDIPKLMAAISQMALANGIHDSQWPKIWQLVGLPDANEEEWAADKEMRAEQRKAQKDMAVDSAKKAIAAPPPSESPQDRPPQGGPPPKPSSGSNKSTPPRGRQPSGSK